MWVCKTLAVQFRTAYRKPKFEDQQQLLESSNSRGEGGGKGGSGRNTPQVGGTHGYQTRCVCTLNLKSVLSQTLLCNAVAFSRAFSLHYRSKGPTEVDTTGVHISHDKSIAVTFHVIVPLEVWNWDNKSSIRIRFGHRKLGNWMCDIGDFCPQR